METRTTCKQFYIKERNNPQLGIYYIKCGQLSKKAARDMEKPGYGYNTMHPYPDEAAYLTAIKELESKGERIQ